MCEEGSVKICTTFSWLCAFLMEQLKIFSKTISRTLNKDYVHIRWLQILLLLIYKKHGYIFS